MNGYSGQMPLYRTLNIGIFHYNWQRCDRPPTAEIYGLVWYLMVCWVSYNLFVNWITVASDHFCFLELSENMWCCHQVYRIALVNGKCWQHQTDFIDLINVNNAIEMFHSLFCFHLSTIDIQMTVMHSRTLNDFQCRKRTIVTILMNERASYKFRSLSRRLVGQALSCVPVKTETSHRALIC